MNEPTLPEAETYLFVPILIAIVTGARRGEIFALQWRDISFETSTMHIRRSLRRNMKLKGPKTASGNRQFSVPEGLLNVLRAQFELCRAVGAEARLDAQIFVRDDGEIIKPNSISTLYRAIVKKAELSPLRFHDLRHSAASLMIEDDVPIPEVAHLLGHADKGFTYGTYVHKVAGENKKRAESMALTANSAQQ